MWLKTGDFATAPQEDFVLSETGDLQATIPVPILKELLPSITHPVFSVILYETLFDQNELPLFDQLITVLQHKGILVVSLGTQSPNTAFAQEVLDLITNHEMIVQPALMTRFKNMSGNNSYAFRFKKKEAVSEQAPLAQTDSKPSKKQSKPKTKK